MPGALPGTSPEWGPRLNGIAGLSPACNRSCNSQQAANWAASRHSTRHHTPVKSRTKVALPRRGAAALSQQRLAACRAPRRARARTTGTQQTRENTHTHAPTRTHTRKPAPAEARLLSTQVPPSRHTTPHTIPHHTRSSPAPRGRRPLRPQARAGALPLPLPQAPHCAPFTCASSPAGAIWCPLAALAPYLSMKDEWKALSFSTTPPRSLSGGRNVVRKW